jgi:hypothetical protein
MLYGFTPNSTVTLTIETSGFVPSISTVTADAYGTYVSYLGTTWPAQSITFRATSGATTVTTTAVKTSSIDEERDAGEVAALGLPTLPGIERAPRLPAE